MLLHALTRQRLNKEAEKGLLICCALYLYYVLRAWSIKLLQCNTQYN